jgi:hypothetical protein
MDSEELRAAIARLALARSQIDRVKTSMQIGQALIHVRRAGRLDEGQRWWLEMAELVCDRDRPDKLKRDLDALAWRIEGQVKAWLLEKPA